jgi:hypothetical protein
MTPTNEYESELSQFWKPYLGAVSLSFDDGTENQLNRIVPLLDRYDFRGTFYIHPHGENWEEKYAPWTDVAEAGHEIGNHTLSHFCSNQIYGRRGGLEDRTVRDIEADILEAQDRLHRIAPNQAQWTFAYPCYLSYVGRGASRRSYVPVVAEHFLAGRIGGEYGFGNHPFHCDTACLWGLPVERMSGYEMIGLVEELVWKHRWVILIFHEVDGKRLSVQSFDFEMLLDYLERRKGDIWIATVREVADKIHKWQNGNEGHQ